MRCTKKTFDKIFSFAALVVAASTLQVTSIARAVGPTVWGYCNEGNHLAYQDSTFSSRKPEADRICNLTSYKDTNEPQSDTLRCLNAELDKCANRLGQGFEGPNDVPNGAWYYQVGAGSVARIRCQCGCFTPDTNVLTNAGWIAIGDLYAKSQMGEATQVRLASLGSTNGDSYVPVGRGDFTKGPESKPVLYVRTASGKALSVTDLHPFPVRRRGQIEMLQARDLVVGDSVKTSDGDDDEIVAVTAYNLVGDNSVYNLNTKGVGGDRQIISANGIMVGDLGWQMQLSAERARADTLVQLTAK